MKIQSKSIEELIDNTTYKKDLFIKLDKIVAEYSPVLGRQFFYTDSISMIGYGIVPYKNSCYDGMWPMVALAPQKNNISLYIMVFENGKPIIEDYKDVFGKSNIGKSCIRLKNLNEEKITAIKQLLDKCSDKYQNNVSIK